MFDKFQLWQLHFCDPIKWKAILEGKIRFALSEKEQTKCFRKVSLLFSFSEWEWERSLLNRYCSYYAAITNLWLSNSGVSMHIFFEYKNQYHLFEYCFSQNTEIKWLVSNTDFLGKSINTCHKYSELTFGKNLYELMPHIDALNLKIRWFMVTQKY